VPCGRSGPQSSRPSPFSVSASHRSRSAGRRRHSIAGAARSASCRRVDGTERDPGSSPPLTSSPPAYGGYFADPLGVVLPAVLGGPQRPAPPEPRRRTEVGPARGRRPGARQLHARRPDRLTGRRCRRTGERGWRFLGPAPLANPDDSAACPDRCPRIGGSLHPFARTPTGSRGVPCGGSRSALGTGR
jgi:hypothetical protein